MLLCLGDAALQTSVDIKCFVHRFGSLWKNSGCSVDTRQHYSSWSLRPLLTELVNSAYMKTERNRWVIITLLYTKLYIYIYKYYYYHYYYECDTSSPHIGGRRPAKQKKKGKPDFRRMSVVNFKCVRLSQFLNYLVLYFLRTCNQLPSSTAIVFTSLTTEGT